MMLQGKEATWAQNLMSTHIKLAKSAASPIVPILGTTRHTDASLSGTASKQAMTAVLPLCAPLLSDMQCLAHSVLRRLPQDKVVVPQKPAWSPQLADDAAAVLNGWQLQSAAL